MKIDIDGNEKQIVEQKRFLLKSDRHFTIEAIRSFRPGLASLGNAPEMAWCLYVLIDEGHPLYEKASQNTTDYDIILGDMIYPFFHEGCTFYHKNSDYIKIGCDYQHGCDKFIMSDTFSDEIPSVILEDIKDLYKFFEDYQDETTYYDSKKKGGIKRNDLHIRKNYRKQELEKTVPTSRRLFNKQRLL